MNTWDVPDEIHNAVGALLKENERLKGENQELAIKLGSYTLPPHIEAELSALRRSNDQLRAELDEARGEIKAALAVFGPGWPDTLLETCQSLKAAEDMVPSDLHGAETLAEAIMWLAQERDNLEQAWAKAEDALAKLKVDTRS